MQREDEVLALTERGTAELCGGGTSLPPDELQALILIDGKSTVARIVERAQGVTPRAMIEAITRLVEQRHVAPAEAPDSDCIDPDSTLSLNIAAGVSPMTAHGFHAGIALRAAERRKLAPGTKIQVLAIDEDPNIAKFLRTYFEPEQYELKVAGDNTQILDALRHPPLPDVVLADASLPGIEVVVAAMRKHEVIGKIPVILFGGTDTREAVLQALRSGVNGYMTKPLDMDALLAGARSVLGLPPEKRQSMGFGGGGPAYMRIPTPGREKSQSTSQRIAVVAPNPGDDPAPRRKISTKDA